MSVEYNPAVEKGGAEHVLPPKEIRRTKNHTHRETHTHIEKN